MVYKYDIFHIFDMVLYSGCCAKFSFVVVGVVNDVVTGAVNGVVNNVIHDVGLNAVWKLVLHKVYWTYFEPAFSISEIKLLFTTEFFSEFSNF